MSNSIKNTYKNSFSSPPPIKEKKQFLPFFQDKRTRLCIGLVLQGTSIFLLAALLSYLATGALDQALVEQFIKEKDFSIKVYNKLGLLGALSTYYVFFKWFGVASLLLPFLTYNVGHRLTFGKALISL